MPQADCLFSIPSRNAAPDIFRAIIATPDERLERIGSKARRLKTLIGMVVDHPMIKNEFDVGDLLFLLWDEVDTIEAMSEGLHKLELAQ